MTRINVSHILMSRSHNYDCDFSPEHYNMLMYSLMYLSCYSNRSVSAPVFEASRYGEGLEEVWTYRARAAIPPCTSLIVSQSLERSERIRVGRNRTWTQTQLCEKQRSTEKRRYNSTASVFLVSGLCLVPLVNRRHV